MSSIPGQDVAISSRNFLVRFTGQQSDQFVYVNAQAHVCIHTRVSRRICASAHIKFRNHVSMRTHTLNKKKTNRWQEGLLRAERSMLFPKN